jgi:hypothetical protein
MKNATRATVSTFGAPAGLAGIQHGIGEVLQGNIVPEGVMILSWPESEVFDLLSGEPAMTIVPTSWQPESSPSSSRWSSSCGRPSS